MSGPATPKRSPSPTAHTTEPASTRQKTSPSPPPAAEEDDEVDGLVLDGETSLAGLYESGWLTPADPSDVLYAPNEELNAKIHIWRGDITELKVDAIVNAANKSLLGGGGVDGAIHSAAGPGLLAECRTLNGADTGETKITGGYDLPAKHVLHTVGPIYSRNNKQSSERLLRSCYQSCLELAVQNGCRTIAFSGISTGIYGYPLDDATQVALDVTRVFLDSPQGAEIDQLIFTVFRAIDASAYRDNTPLYFPPPTSTTSADATAEPIAVDSPAPDPASTAAPPEPTIAHPASSATFDPPPAVAESTEVWGTAASLDEPVAVDSVEVAKAVAGEPPSRTWTPVPGEGAGDGGLLRKMVMPRDKENDVEGEEVDKAGWGEVSSEGGVKEGEVIGKA